MAAVKMTEGTTQNTPFGDRLSFGTLYTSPTTTNDYSVPLYKMTYESLNLAIVKRNKKRKF